MSRFKSIKGFTLLEVLAAIVIFSIVITLLFASFRAFTSSGRHVKASLEQSRDMRSVLRRIRTDIQAAFILQPPRYKKPDFNSDPDPFAFVGGRETVGGRVVSFIAFSSHAHLPVYPGDRDGIARILYYLRPNLDESLDLCRADYLIPSPEVLRTCADPVVYQDITGFEVQFFNRDGESFEEWNSDSEAVEYTVPERVSVLIKQNRGDEEFSFEMTVSLTSSRRSIE